MASVGVRELRQNASEVLRRVEAGEEIEVTVNGRLAARIVPALRAVPNYPPTPTPARPLKLAEFLTKLAEIPDDNTGWAEEIYAARDNDPLFDPWADR
ncbi:type II toxin-antitoxin system Phd/YefM family antitoxin [Gryllotalpicola protaetiae]|uniref:Antitoxin n=1 Tax=Gryllotalpicola protaetiae TaxID=2419771 RepID=A0A387BHE5_9MICO|nr:type II toxin-antitoxin system prevent-host-death family antitoxin [Gryllotalpicola protaetiae]AYG03253.1 type II toxin-antitoxin system prevent-host-death family antitoxin [Gryllotalpicola protaetiae]